MLIFISTAMVQAENYLAKDNFLGRIYRNQRGNVMKKTMLSIISAVFLVLLAPILATQVSTYAAQTDANDTLVIVFNLMVWGIPLGIAAALIIGVFANSKRD